MRIERTGQSMSKLLTSLEEDLRREDITHIERVPTPRPGERYREVVFRYFTEFGIATVYIRIKSHNFERRYVITAKYDWTVGGIVEGWIVEGDVVRIYEPVAMSLEDIGKTLDYFGETFWKAEEKLLGQKMVRAYTED